MAIPGSKFLIKKRVTQFESSAKRFKEHHQGVSERSYYGTKFILSPVNITSTVKTNNIIEIQAFPESNDVVGLKDLYLSFAVGDSEINMVKDTITSGEQISGVGYKVTSSYSNGALIRG